MIICNILEYVLQAFFVQVFIGKQRLIFLKEENILQIHYKRYTTHCTLHTVHCTLYTAQLYTAQRTLHKCTLHNVHCTMHTAQLYTAHTLFTVTFCLIFKYPCEPGYFCAGGVKTTCPIGTFCPGRII